MDGFGVSSWSASPDLAGDAQKYGDRHSFSDLDHLLTPSFTDVRISALLEPGSPVVPQECSKDSSGGSSARRSEETVRPRKRKKRAVPTNKLAEQRRRDRIRANVKVLRELIPNSDKLDQASLLEKAISHIKTLQWQIQIMQGMNPFPYSFVPSPSVPNIDLKMDLSANLSIIHPHSTLPLPFGSFSPSMAGNFIPVPFLAPNSYFHPSMSSTFMQPQFPAMLASPTTPLSSFFKETEGAANE